MNKRFAILAVVAALALAGQGNQIWARGFGGGGFHGGGFRGGDFGGGGFHGGDFGGGEFRGGVFGGARGFDGAGRDWDRSGNGYGADRYAGDRAPTQGDLNRFLGLPSDQGFHAMGATQGAGRVANDRNFDGANRLSPTQRQNWANNVRNNYNHWNGYNSAWYADHPGAWAAAGWGAGTAWNAATWGGLGTWFGGAWGAPIDYAYGNNIAYQDGQVYVNGQDTESAEAYYDQVANQADGGAQADAPADGQWLPLGVFALGQDDQTQTGAVVQLAVNKQGIVRGNYTDTVSGENSPIQGAVDEKTQRLAFSIGSNTSTVLETGLYNLTMPDASVLIHFGPERTQQWTLVRLDNANQPATGASAPDAPAPDAPAPGPSEG